MSGMDLKLTCLLSSCSLLCSYKWLGGKWHSNNNGFLVSSCSILTELGIAACYTHHPVLGSKSITTLLCSCKDAHGDGMAI